MTLGTILILSGLLFGASIGGLLAIRNKTRGAAAVIVAFSAAAINFSAFSAYLHDQSAGLLFSMTALSAALLVTVLWVALARFADTDRDKNV